MLLVGQVTKSVLCSKMSQKIFLKKVPCWGAMSVPKRQLPGLFCDCPIARPVFKLSRSLVLGV